MEATLMDNKKGFSLFDEKGKAVGKIVWKQVENVLVMNGTFVDPSLRGKNAGVTLLNAAANYAREKNLKLKAICPYVVKKFAETTDYDDVKI